MATDRRPTTAEGRARPTYPPGSHPGIVVLRAEDQSAPAVVEAFVKLVRAHDLADLVGTITVVHRGLLWIRR